jgi:hypothetical protein
LTLISSQGAFCCAYKHARAVPRGADRVDLGGLEPVKGVSREDISHAMQLQLALCCAVLSCPVLSCPVLCCACFVNSNVSA